MGTCPASPSDLVSQSEGSRRATLLVFPDLPDIQNSLCFLLQVTHQRDQRLQVF